MHRGPGTPSARRGESARNVLPRNPVTFVPLNLIAPDVGLSSCTITRPRVDFPQPDSPTNPRVSPRLRAKLTLSTALKVRLRKPRAFEWNERETLSTSRIFLFASDQSKHQAASFTLRMRTQHRAERPGAISASGGSSVAHRTTLNGHRGS